MSPPRTWTVAEARAALPRVRELLLVLQRAATLATKVRSNGHAGLHSSKPETTPDSDEGSFGDPTEVTPPGGGTPGGGTPGCGTPGGGTPRGGASGGGASGGGVSGASGVPGVPPDVGVSGAGGGIQPILDGLEELGIVLRDPARGLIDFPAVHLGRQIQLCWQLGEDDIGWWHFPEEGFAGRHPLPLPESW